MIHVRDAHAGRCHLGEKACHLRSHCSDIASVNAFRTKADVGGRGITVVFPGPAFLYEGTVPLFVDALVQKLFRKFRFRSTGIHQHSGGSAGKERVSAGEIVRVTAFQEAIVKMMAVKNLGIRGAACNVREKAGKAIGLVGGAHLHAHAGEKGDNPYIGKPPETGIRV